MKPVQRTVLFCRVQAGKKMLNYPVAVFGKRETAKAFGAALYLAHKAGDQTRVKELDDNFPLEEDGTMPAKPAWSVADLRYEPDLKTAGSDAVEDYQPAAT